MLAVVVLVVILVGVVMMIDDCTSLAFMRPTLRLKAPAANSAAKQRFVSPASKISLTARNWFRCLAPNILHHCSFMDVDCRVQHGMPSLAAWSKPSVPPCLAKSGLSQCRLGHVFSSRSCRSSQLQRPLVNLTFMGQEDFCQHLQNPCRE